MELLITMVVLSVLALITLPLLQTPVHRSKEATLRTNLRLVRDAVRRFHEDTDCYPLTLAALASTAPPATGYNGGGQVRAIAAADWQGPYVVRVPPDPVSGASFLYDTTPPGTGQVISSANGTATDGTLYSTW